MLIDLAVRRIVFTVMLMAALVVFGLLGLRELGISRYPEVEFPRVEVRTELSGADPDIIEADVTDVLEESFNTVSGIRSMSSRSVMGRSSISVEFDLERDIDMAAQDMREKISGVRRQLPDDIDEPSVSKVNPNTRPFLWIAVRGFLPVQDLTRYAEDVFKPNLEKLRGVGGVRVAGKRERTVRIWLDPAQLAGYALTVQDVIAAVRDKHVKLPGGTLETPGLEFAVKTEGEVKRPAEFGQIVVAYRDGAPITIGDLGRVEDGLEDWRGIARHNGIPTVGLGVRLQPGANMVAVADRVYAAMEEIKPMLPPEVSFHYSTDQSGFVRESIGELQFAVLMCTVLVVLTIFLFLRNVAATIIVGLTIPISFIGTFGFMRFLGFSLNELTLLAMALAVGVIVDDAIVVLENIYRRREEGAEPIEGAIQATKEVFFAVVSTTLSLVAVFVPVAFLKGFVGRFFYEFGMTIAIAVCLSSLVALTLTPMLCAYLLRVGTGHNVLFRFSEAGFLGAERFYGTALRFSLRHRFVMIAIGVATLGFAYSLSRGIGREFLPENDEGLYSAMVKTPPGSSLTYTASRVQEIDQIVLSMPETYGLFSIAGGFLPVNQGMMFVRLKPRAQRERSQDDLMAELRERANGLPGVKTFPLPRRNMFGSGFRGNALEVTLRGPDLDVLAALDERVRRRVETEIPGVVDLDSDLERNLPELHANIDREAVEDLGLDVRNIALTLQALVGGLDIATYKEGGRRYDVRVKLLDEYRRDPVLLGGLQIRNNRNDLVRLSAVADLDMATGLSTVNRYNRQRSVTISGTPKGISQGDALARIRAIILEELPDGYTMVFTGQADIYGEAIQSLLFAMGLAVVFVYMVLGSQFNSFLHPFTIMLALPLSAVGAVGALYLSNNTFNMFSMIGIILLVGLVIKNSILLVDRARRGEREGLSARDAMLVAGRIRFRPILMTAFTTIFGMLPIALGLGPGSETRVPMGISAAGGMLTATLLTLLVIPAIYTLFADFSTSGPVRALTRVLRRFSSHAESPPPPRQVEPAVPAAQPATPDAYEIRD